MHIREIRSMTGKTYFTIKQTTKRREFLEFIQHYYDQDNFYTKIRDYQQGKYFTSELSSPATYEIGEQRKRWYPNGIKIVPKDLKLNPVIVSFWFQGDGDAGRGGKDGNSVKANFSTNSFTLEDVKFLMEQLMDLGIESTTYMKEKTHPIISISTASEVKKLMDMIRPFMLECFQYKLQDPHIIKTGNGSHKRSPEKQKEYYHNLDPEIRTQRNHNNWENVKHKRNPERKQRYKDDAEFRQKCLDRSNKNYKPHPRIREIVPCIFCKSGNTRKYGKVITQTSSYDRVKCNNCHKIFQHNKTDI